MCILTLAVSDTAVKLLDTSSTHCPRNCYLMLKGQGEIGRTNWATSIKNPSCLYGFGIVWITEDVGDLLIRLRNFKT